MWSTRTSLRKPVSTCNGFQYADPARRRKLPKVLLAACVQIARKQRRDAAVGGHAPLFAASTTADGSGLSPCDLPPLSRTPVCAARATAQERATALVALLHLHEKVLQLGSSAPAIARLGVPAIEFWGEALHGIWSSGRTKSPSSRIRTFVDSTARVGG